MEDLHQIHSSGGKWKNALVTLWSLLRISGTTEPYVHGCSFIQRMQRKGASNPLSLSGYRKYAGRTVIYAMLQKCACACCMLMFFGDNGSHYPVDVVDCCSTRIARKTRKR